jgi:hypothetical protein
MKLIPGSRSRAMDRHPERGGILVVVMICLPAVLASAAVAIDIGHLLSVRARLQGTADASALAAAAQLPHAGAALAEAQKYSELNYSDQGQVVNASDVVLGNWTGTAFVPGGSPSNAVRVTARRGAANGNPISLFLGSAMGQRLSSVSASAVAIGQAGLEGASCIIALDSAITVEALHIHSSRVEAPCGVQVNSRSCLGGSSNAMRMESLARIQATFIRVAGCATLQGGSTASPAPATGSPQVADPLRSIPAPAIGACTPGRTSETVISSGTHTISPGVYCGGLRVNKTAVVTMQPGEYIMRGGGFRVDGETASVTGDAVMIYLTCNHANGCAGSTLNPGAVLTNSSTIRLSAPASGPRRGILFFLDNRMPTRTESVIMGNSDATFDGTIYLPGQPLRLQASQARVRLALVAGTIRIDGNATYQWTGTPTNARSELGGEGSTLQLVQ